MTKLRYNPISMLWHLIKNDAHKLEYDPATQWKFHRNMTRFWVCNFLVALAVYFLAPELWNKASILYLVLVSLYANAATDYGAVPSSYAAMKADEIQQAQTTQISTDNIVLAVQPEYMAEIAAESRENGHEMAHSALKNRQPVD